MFRSLFMAIVGLATLSGCDGISGSETYRYRMTVEIDTPQGVRSGSSVREVRTTQGMGIPDRSLRTRVRGEAIPIDLPGGTLFALMRGDILGYDYADRLVIYHLSKHPELGVKSRGDWASDVRQIKKRSPSFELTPDEYPQLVRFADKAVPRSIEEIEPSKLADIYGSGVRLKRVTVAVTTDEPTSRIEDILPWLDPEKGAFERCPPGTALRDMPLKCRTTSGEFSRKF